MRHPSPTVVAVCAAVLLCAPLAGCCANQFHATMTPHRGGGYAGVEVLPVAVEAALEPTPDSDVVANAQGLYEYLRDELPAAPAGAGSVLRLQATFTKYQPQVFVVPGEAVVRVQFYDAAGALVADGEVDSGNPSLGRGSYASCTTVEELGGGIVDFVEEKFGLSR
jgi:hypothetical protein